MESRRAEWGERGAAVAAQWAECAGLREIDRGEAGELSHWAWRLGRAQGDDWRRVGGRLRPGCEA